MLYNLLCNISYITNLIKKYKLKMIIFYEYKKYSVVNFKSAKVFYYNFNLKSKLYSLSNFTLY